MKSLRRNALPVFILALVTCAQLAVADANPQADEAAIRAAVKSWSAAAQEKDAETFASFYAEDAVLMLEGAPNPTGLEAIGEGIRGMMQDPHFDLSFETTKIEVAASGDLAYETGTYSLTMSDPEGNPAPQKGHYVVVWRKQPDGTWKVAIDAPISDPPEKAPTD